MRALSDCFHTTMVLTQPVLNICRSFWCSMFPYHYGSHATILDAWYEQDFSSFHTTMVLTQRRPCSFPPLSTVSIPLWFSRNYPYRTVVNLPFMFPYHYGSHATFALRPSLFRLKWFPYHYGSHATAFITEIIQDWGRRSQIYRVPLLGRHSE